MNKSIITILFTGLAIGAMLTQPVAAFDGWETSITVTAAKAESRLSFGQRPDATDLTDGLYDVPAMLSGTLQVYFQTEAESFWRDIRAMTSDQEWRLIIASQTGEPVSLTWNPANLPADAETRLTDTSNGTELDMKSTTTYTLASSGNALLLIEVTNR